MLFLIGSPHFRQTVKARLKSSLGNDRHVKFRERLNLHAGADKDRRFLHPAFWTVTTLAPEAEASAAQ